MQIFTLNMTYDVPVKLFSFHLILMSLVLMAPEASRHRERAGVQSHGGAVGAAAALPAAGRLVLVALAVQLGYGAFLVLDDYAGAHQSLVPASAAARRSRRSTASGTSRR